MAMSKPCEDHLENTYKSIAEMCKHYNIPYKIYNTRIERGWSKKDALTITANKHNNKNGQHCEDYLGNTYKSVTEMCKYHNIPYNVYVARITRGWSKKDALTTPPVNKHNSKNGQHCEDHLGNAYESLKEMCEHYNMLTSTYIKRIKRGWSKKDALTTPLQKRTYTNNKKDRNYRLQRYCQEHNCTKQSVINQALNMFLPKYLDNECCSISYLNPHATPFMLKCVKHVTWLEEDPKQVNLDAFNRIYARLQNGEYKGISEKDAVRIINYRLCKYEDSSIVMEMGRIRKAKSLPEALEVAIDAWLQEYQRKLNKAVV